MGFKQTVLGSYVLALLPSTFAQAPRAPFRVDVHTHPLPGFYRQALLDGGYLGSSSADIIVDGFRQPNWTLESYLDNRIEFGYNYSIMSITAPGVSFLHGNARAQHLARQLNDQMFEWTKAHPTQLGAFCILPLPDINSSLAEIAHCLDDLEFDGVGVYTNYEGVYLGDPSFDPLFHELERRAVTVFVHPTALQHPPSLYNLGLPAIEYPFDTVRAVANIVSTRARLRFPTLNLIFSHGGGALPYLWERLAGQPGLNASEATATLKSFYYDTAIVVGPSQFSSLSEFVSVDQIVTGSDFPYLPTSVLPRLQNALASVQAFTPGDQEKIAWRNTFRLFPALNRRFPELQ